VNREMETQNSAGKSHIKRLAICSLICLALVAAPLYCSLNSVTKKMTNEEIILNWIDKTRKGQTVKTTDPPKTKKTTAESITIREEQIKAVDKDPDGWLVTTKENRLLFVPRTDD